MFDHHELLTIALPTSFAVAPVARIARTSKSINPELSPVSALATRDWLERSFLGKLSLRHSLPSAFAEFSAESQLDLD